MIQDPSMRTAQRSGELDWLLDDLVLRVSEVRHAVVLSNDGLAVGASSDLRREDAEHLAAVASGFHSLAKGAGRHFGAGGVRQTMVEMDDGFLFVAAAGDGSCLAVLTAVLTVALPWLIQAPRVLRVSPGPVGMLRGQDVSFGVRHQAEHLTAGVAHAGHVGLRSVRIDGIGAWYAL